MSSPLIERSGIPQPPHTAPVNGVASPGIPSPPPVVQAAPAGRRVNKRLALLSVLVILLGGLLGLVGAQALTGQSTVVAVARPVAVGATLTEADLVAAKVSSDPRVSTVPYADRGQLVGRPASVALFPGQLLTRQHVGAPSGVTGDRLLVALPLKEGQLPARGLAAGQNVLVVPTPGSGGGAPDAAAEALSAGVRATVAGVGARSAASQVTVVDLLVSSRDGAALARLGSTGRVAVIVLPEGR